MEELVSQMALVDSPVNAHRDIVVNGAKTVSHESVTSSAYLFHSMQAIYVLHSLA